jgi:uncharacterized protein (DUF433 family)
MVIASLYPHIEPNEMGIPHIGKSRYQVLHLAAEHYHHGWSAEELLRQHPDLRPEEVYSTLAYFYDHFESMLEQMQARTERQEARVRNQSVTRDQLLKRHAEIKG